MLCGGLHPGLEGYASEPVLDGGDEAREILTDMLLRDDPDWHLLAGGHRCLSKELSADFMRRL